MKQSRQPPRTILSPGHDPQLYTEACRALRLLVVADPKTATESRAEGARQLEHIFGGNKYEMNLALQDMVADALCKDDGSSVDAAADMLKYCAMSLEDVQAVLEEAASLAPRHVAELIRTQVPTEADLLDLLAVDVSRIVARAVLEEQINVSSDTLDRVYRRVHKDVRYASLCASHPAASRRILHECAARPEAEFREALARNPAARADRSIRPILVLDPSPAVAYHLALDGKPSEYDRLMQILLAGDPPRAVDILERHPIPKSSRLTSVDLAPLFSAPGDVPIRAFAVMHRVADAKAARKRPTRAGR
jgi:hypothetical protein